MGINKSFGEENGMLDFCDGVKDSTCNESNCEVYNLCKTKKEKQNNNRPSKDQYYLGIALAVSKRSTCLKRHYGCVIVKDDVIIATGYNGSPRGEVNCCDKGTCHRMGIEHNSGNYVGCPAVHAEQNAMLQAPRDLLLKSTVYMSGEEYDMSEVWECTSWQEVDDCSPCPICLAMMKNAGITKVVNRNGVLSCL